MRADAPTHLPIDLREFDRLGDKSINVKDAVDLLISWLTIQPGDQQRRNSARPPAVEFKWGQGIHFVGVLKQVSIQYLMFSPNGHPLRATASIYLQATPDDPKPTNPTSGGTAGRATERFDEGGKAYKGTADDSAYATFRLKGGVIAHINMSWVTRVYRDDLVTFQVDGTHGSAVAGLSDCVIQARQATPRPVWNPDEKRHHDFYADWQRLPENASYDNGFREQWEMFIRHVCEDAPYKYTLLEGAKGVQLAECALQSWRERRWVDVAPIKV